MRIPDNYAASSDSAKVGHRYTREGYLKSEEVTNSACPTFAHLVEVPFLRASVRHIRHLGKRCEAAVLALLASDGVVSWDDLVAALGTKVKNLRRARWLPRAVAAGVIETSTQGVFLRPEWREAIEKRRIADGEVPAETRDCERYRRESQDRARAWRRSSAVSPSLSGPPQRYRVRGR